MTDLMFPLASDAEVQLQQYERAYCTYSVPSTELIDIHAPSGADFYLGQFRNGDWAFCFRLDGRRLPQLPGWRFAPVINEIRIRVAHTAFATGFESYREELAFRIMSTPGFDGLRRGIYSQPGTERPRIVFPAGGAIAGARAFARQYWPGNETPLGDDFSWGRIPVPRGFLIAQILAATSAGNELSIAILFTQAAHIAYENDPSVPGPQIYSFDVDQYFRELAFHSMLRSPRRGGARHPYLRSRLRSRADVATWTSTIEAEVRNYPYHAVLTPGTPVSGTTVVEIAGGLQAPLLSIPLMDDVEVDEKVLTLGRRIFSPPALVADRFVPEAVLYGAVTPTQPVRWDIQTRGTAPAVEFENWQSHASLAWDQLNTWSGSGPPPAGRSLRDVIVSTAAAGGASSGLAAHRLGFAFRAALELEVTNALAPAERVLSDYARDVDGTVTFHGRTHRLADFLGLYGLLRHFPRALGPAGESALAGAMDPDGASPYQRLRAIHSRKTAGLSRHVGDPFLESVHVLIDQGFRLADGETIIALAAVTSHLRGYSEGRARLSEIFADFYDEAARSTGDRPRLTLLEFAGAWRQWVRPAPGGTVRRDAAVQAALLELLRTWTTRDVIGRCQQIRPSASGSAALAEITAQFEAFRTTLNEGPFRHLGLELTGSPRFTGGALLQVIERGLYSWNAGVEPTSAVGLSLMGQSLDFILDFQAMIANPGLVEVSEVGMGAYGLVETSRALSESHGPGFLRPDAQEGLGRGRFPLARVLGFAEGAIAVARAAIATADYLERDDDDAAAWSIVTGLGALASTTGVLVGPTPIGLMLLAMGFAFSVIGALGESRARDPAFVTALRHVALGASYDRVVEEPQHELRFLHDDYQRFGDFRLHEIHVLSQLRRVEVEVGTPISGVIVTVRPDFALASGSRVRVLLRQLMSTGWRTEETVEFREAVGPWRPVLGAREYLVEPLTESGKRVFRISLAPGAPPLPSIDQVLAFVSWTPVDSLGATLLDPTDALVWWRQPALSSLGTWSVS